MVEVSLSEISFRKMVAGEISTCFRDCRNGGQSRVTSVAQISEPRLNLRTTGGFLMESDIVLTVCTSYSQR